MDGAAKHVVVRRFSVLAGGARFVIAPDDEDRVVGAGGDRQQREQVGRVGRQADDPELARTATTPRAAANSTRTVTSTRSMVTIER